MTALLTLAQSLGIDPGPLNQTELQEQTCSAALAEIQHWRDQLDKTCEEGCTPADAEKLKDFNAQLAYENFDLKNERDSLAAQVERLRGEIRAIMCDSSGVAGYHLNGEIARWDEFSDLEEMLSDPTPTALTALKAQWQAEAGDASDQ